VQAAKHDESRKLKHIQAGMLISPSPEAPQGWLKRSREAFLDAHGDATEWRSRLFSGTTYALWEASRAPMRSFCRGLVLDAGSGRGAWRSLILESAQGYESIDMAPRHDHAPTWIGDICTMTEVPDHRYDTVVCHQVLEHVRHPSQAVKHMSRVLKPGGTLILSVPHLSRRHELPHDYYRFTQEGLGVLLSDAGLEIGQITAYGGVLSFLHHQASMIVPGMFAGLPLIGTVFLACNAPLSWCAVWLDRLIDRSRLLPTGVVAIASRPA
jgi:SAM-dependent methyltransferase